MLIPPRTAAALVLTLALAAPSAAQPGQPDGEIPPALLAQFRRDLASEVIPGAERVRVLGDGKVDLDGDGSLEYVLTSALLCGTIGNCTYWVYRALPGGGWQRFHEGYGHGVEALAHRTNGFLDIYSDSRFPPQRSFRVTHAFDGAEYVWTATELRAAAGPDSRRTGYRVWSPVPERRAGSPPEPRTVTLSSVDVRGAGVRISATYTTCAPGQATPGELCGEARLVLSGSAGSAPWPAAPACFTLLRRPWEGPTRPAGELCPGEGPAGGTVALVPTRAQLDAIHASPSVQLRKGGFVLALTGDDDSLTALRDFITAVYHLNEIEPPGMLKDEEEAAEPGTSNRR